MKNFKYLFFVLTLLFFTQMSVAQEKKPKIAVVLSGGGARGIAHISTLQMLDSLGIVPDMILGTSMGSVVGGLYAMGYSGDEIEKLTRETNWETLFGGGISLQDISNEEKSEYDRYLIDFDFVKGKPKVSNAIINDQNLREYLNALTYPVYNISDFDKLPIPYRAVATDIVEGKEVVLASGSLNFAMRASMSIPGIFMPVDYENTILVDGGVLNNFPTDIAKSMGADIIIGSDVGGGMKPKEELDNIGTLVFQTGMLSSNLKNPGNRALCDILIDHVPHLTYETGDFAKATKIYEEGKIATAERMAQFVDLANKLKRFDQRKVGLPDVKDDFYIEEIKYKGVSEQNMGLVTSRADFKEKKNYSTETIIEGVDKMIGTNLFDRVGFSIEKDKKDYLRLEIDAVEQSRHQVKGSLHYDTFSGIGLIFNYTGRNVIGNSSRILATIDISEQNRYRVQYQKIFGSDKDWWFRTEAYLENILRGFYLNGEVVEDFKTRFGYINAEINKNIISFKSYAGIGAAYEYTGLKPEVDPDISPNILSIEKYQFKNLNVFAQYVHNSFDRVFYPTKGIYYRGIISHSFLHDVNMNYADETIGDFKKPTNSFTKLGLDFEKRYPISEKLTGIIGANMAFTFYDAEVTNDEASYTDFGYGAKYYLGGVITRPRKDNYVLPGLKENEVAATQFMMAQLALQYNIKGKLFLTPHVNFASVGFQDFDEFIDNAFSPKGDWQITDETSTLISAGATVSVNTFLGPIDFDVSWVNDINKFRLFFGIGYQFNRSN
ncbi:MAG: patatin-like phospholipase family protein [Lutimonas sp.]